ncbi:hypothetical protein [Embleya scabrispora]|uniref:hypothetical protein n=1 Tax=Embleya scabrispora TaxID=159449 RepID=UPI00131A42CE|nr:hypothetical protein [Embleya scabrispora]MYS78816.1 hypothetical protein [Streptomyces sp. SID5474]
MADVWNTPLDQLERRMSPGWAIGPAARAADEAAAERVQTGEFVGFDDINGDPVRRCGEPIPRSVR